MNLRNFLTLTIRATDLNLLAQRPELLEKLRQLTLHQRSGLNLELNVLLKNIQTRAVSCKIITAYRHKELVGWALLSNEDSNIYYFGTKATKGTRFKKEDGWLFQVYVDPKHRRQGIASAILKKARKISKKEVLCVCPWDDQSTSFFDNNPQTLIKWL